MTQTVRSIDSTRASWASHAIHEQKRGLAKLLATENITVRHERAETAMFDVKSRTLLLPLWEDLTIDQYDLLIGHEVGHAKYTPMDDAVFAEFAQDANFKTYVNVLEDVRIERLMQDAFPGLRPAFRRGYADFFNKGPIFESSTLRPSDTYALIDRLNLHFKLGSLYPMSFSSDEQTIVRRAFSTESFTEVVALARELYQSAKQSSRPAAQSGAQSQPSRNGSQSQEGSSQSAQPSQDGAESQDGASQSGQSPSSSDQSGASDAPAGDSSSANTASEGQSDENGSGSSATTQTSSSAGEGSGSGAGVTPEQPYAETDVQTANALREFTRTHQSAANPHAPVDAVFPSLSRDAYERQGVIVPLQTLYSQWTRFEERYGCLADVTALLDKRLAAFDREHASSIALLAQEFTRKQSAKLRERSRVSTTGVLNPTTLHAYRLREDLFRQVRVLPKGKQHGLVVLVDGSASMRNALADVYTQALFLASFAMRVRIPCIVAVFGAAEGSLIPKTMNDQTKVSTPTVMGETPVTAQLKVVWDSTCAAVRTGDQRRYLARLLTNAEIHTARRGRRGMLGDVPSWMGPVTPDAYHQWSLLGSNVPGTSYGHTPLVTGVLASDALLRSLVQQHRVQKSTLVVLTDGEASDSFTVVDASSTDDSYYSRHRGAVILRDPQTRTTIATGHQAVSTDYWYDSGQPTRHDILTWRTSSIEQLRAAYQVLRARYGVRIIGLAIVPSKGARAEAGVYDMLKTMGVPTYATVSETNSYDGTSRRQTRATDVTSQLSRPTVERMVATLKSAGLVTVPVLPVPLYDLGVLIGSETLHLEEDEFESLDTRSMTTAQIVRAFKKTQVGLRSNRTLVHTLVPFLA